MAGAGFVFTTPLLFVSHTPWGQIAAFMAVAGAVWWGGYWILRKNRYFISASSFGYEDAFGGKTLLFDEVESVRLNYGGRIQKAEFTCKNRQVSISIDGVSNNEWWNAVRQRLESKNVPLSQSLWGFRLPKT